MARLVSKWTCKYHQFLVNYLWFVNIPSLLAIYGSIKSTQPGYYIYIGNNQPALGSTGRLKRIETFHRFESNQNWLVVEPPLWKIWKSMGMIIPYIMENKNVWSHQPEKKTSICLTCLTLPKQQTLEVEKKIDLSTTDSGIVVNRLLFLF